MQKYLYILYIAISDLFKTIRDWKTLLKSRRVYYTEIKVFQSQLRFL